MYNWRWVTDDTFIIGDKEYGYDLLKISIFQELKDVLSEAEVEVMMEEIATTINRKMREAKSDD